MDIYAKAKYMLNRGINPFIVAKIAGHNSLEQIQKTYGHAYDDNKKEAAEIFGSFIEPSVLVINGIGSDGRFQTELHDSLSKAMEALDAASNNSKSNDKPSRFKLCR